MSGYPIIGKRIRLMSGDEKIAKGEDEFQSKSIPFVPMDMRSSPSMSCS